MTTNGRGSIPTGRRGSQRSSLWERPGFLIRRLHQIHVAIFLEECAAENITPVQFGLLSVLLEEPGCDQITLAEKLGIDRTNVADVVRRLERRGWITRVVNAADRRMRVVSLTDEGRKFVGRTHAKMQRAQTRLLSPLNEADRARFVELLGRLVAANNALGRAKLRAGESD
jgi:DNA-binding MarR family transcriptional regulator